MKSVPLLPSSLPNARVEDLGESELLTGNVEVRGLMIEMWCHVEYVETYHGGTLGKHVDMYHDSIYDRCTSLFGTYTCIYNLLQNLCSYWRFLLLAFKIKPLLRHVDY